MSSWLNMVVDSSINKAKSRLKDEYEDYSLREFLHEIETHLLDALQADALLEVEIAREEIRKIAVLASKCMEIYGCSNE